jgi:hypothetical protein
MSPEKTKKIWIAKIGSDALTWSKRHRNSAIWGGRVRQSPNLPAEYYTFVIFWATRGWNLPGNEPADRTGRRQMLRLTAWCVHPQVSTHRVSLMAKTANRK